MYIYTEQKILTVSVEDLTLKRSINVLSLSLPYILDYPLSLYIYINIYI